MLILALLAAATPIDRSPADARRVVERYYAAIERHDYRTAYRLWDRGGTASGRSFAAFARGFADTAHSRVVAGAPTDGEGAAGSSFITVPVRVEARTRGGVRQRFVGRYTLRRVNDVDGATPDQLSWHIASARLTAAR
jgi:hypothetical protein